MVNNPTSWHNIKGFCIGIEDWFAYLGPKNGDGAGTSSVTLLIPLRDDLGNQIQVLRKKIRPVATGYWFAVNWLLFDYELAVRSTSHSSSVTAIFAYK